MFIILVQIHHEAVFVKIMNCGLLHCQSYFWSRTKDGGKISTVYYVGITDLNEENE